MKLAKTFFSVVTLGVVLAASSTVHAFTPAFCEGIKKQAPNPGACAQEANLFCRNYMDAIDNAEMKKQIDHAAYLSLKQGTDEVVNGWQAEAKKGSLSPQFCSQVKMQIKNANDSLAAAKAAKKK
ncbi:MAG: hypothetical protein NTX56_02385 [Proteobacteria bacterium]|nr:hypothetical protein [Pseudomonadota bacterium]